MTWLLKIALKKAVVRIVQVALAFLAAHQADLAAWGLTVGVDHAVLEGTLTAALTGGLEIVRNFLKTRYPGKFGWL